MTVGSLFAGIGGFDLGFERAGFEVKWQVEIDPFCRAVLAKHWPDVRRYEDVRTVDGLEPVDVLCAGFPCQDISSNNQYKRGIGGEKSGLWRQVVRVVRLLEPKPTYLVLENVSDLLVRGMGVVLRDLANVGFDAEWECLPAAVFGLPQPRWRVLIVAYPRRGGCEVSDERFSSGPFAGIRFDGDGLAQAEHAAAEGARRVCGMDAGLSGTVDRVGALGNSVSPVVTEWIARRILEAEAA